MTSEFSQSDSMPPPQQQEQEQQQQQQQHSTSEPPQDRAGTRTRTRLPIRTYHCSFCKQILLASTRDVARLPTRQGGGLDKAGILPLPGKTEAEAEGEGGEGREYEEEEEAAKKGIGKGKEQAHYTILLSTTAVSTQPTIIRRQDGFEKRFLIRCGRCRVVCGYALDKIHFPLKKDKNGGGDAEGKDDGADVVYILPGAVVETGEMMRNTENKVDMTGWEKWEDHVPAT